MSIFKSAQTNRQNPEPEEYENRNYLLALMNGILIRISFRFVDSTKILAVFVKQLTNSNIMVGLVSSTMRAGWMWPQLIMSNLMEHRPRKMPFYYIGFSFRVISWSLIVLLTLIVGNKSSSFLFLGFYLLYFLASSGLGVGTLPFNDIVAKSVPARRRARLFSLRALWGGILGVGTGFVIKYILRDEFSLTFPYNYALMFGLSTLVMVCSSVCFMMSKEPIHPVRDSRKPFWEHLKRGPKFLKEDRDYRYFLFFRIMTSFGGMSIPFYTTYALDYINISASTIGIYTAVAAGSGILSNLLWVHVGEKYGSRSVLIVSTAFACIAPTIPIITRYLPSEQRPVFYSLVFILTEALISGQGIGYMTYSLNMAPSMSRPTYLGFLNTLMFPMSFVPLLAGSLINILSYEFVFIISIVTSAFAVYIGIKLTNVDKRDDIESKGD